METSPFGFFLLLLFSSSFISAYNHHHHHLDLNNTSNDHEAYLFPPNFLFGTATSAYQVEGAYLTDGKRLNNWDVYTHNSSLILPFPTDGNNGDVTVDQYHRYQEHVDIMASSGLNSYQFSISWARILPRGVYGSINYAGIDYYNKLIDSLLLKGIQPFVVLNHFDSPDELERRYGSWLSSRIVKDFLYLAEICFKNFGDRVKHWVTFSEPNLYVIGAYRSGMFPPNRCSKPFGYFCTQGDSEKEPFVAAHNTILAHAAAVKIYRTKYQKKQGGSIGLIVQTVWYEPLSNSTADKLATERAHSFFYNWFLEPVIFGRYPKEMTDLLESTTLPKFSSNDIEDLKLGVDFIGINHYVTLYVGDCMLSHCELEPGTTRTEGFIRQSFHRDGIPVGELTGDPPLRSYPPGMEKTVTYIKERYNNIPIIITENGYCEETDPSTFEESLNDKKRIQFLNDYLYYLLEAMRKGADVRGYFVWTLLDDYEWLKGFTRRYGLHHVDHTTQKSTPKASATWFKEFITNHTRNPQLAQY